MKGDRMACAIVCAVNDAFMLSLPPITLRLRGWKLIDRVALVFCCFVRSRWVRAAACCLFTPATYRKFGGWKPIVPTW